ncbi:MAG: hypothetical protein ACOX2R_03355 [Anaerolineae bacterium]
MTFHAPRVEPLTSRVTVVSPPSARAIKVTVRVMGAPLPITWRTACGCSLVYV